MEVDNVASETKRITITIPKDLLEEIRAYSTSISGFLTEAAAERLKHERYQRSVTASAGAWRREDHADLDEIDGITHYVTSLRSSWIRED